MQPKALNQYNPRTNIATFPHINQRSSHVFTNLWSGDGGPAKMMLERMGKIRQEKESISINRTDTSVSRSVGLDYAVPASKISSLSSGEFVGYGGG